MTYEENLKILIRNTEDRYIWYKKEIESLFKNKNIWPVDDNFTIWYKEFLREEKNLSESHLKELQIEMTHFRQGMNPPFCYGAYKRKVLVGMFTEKGSPVTLNDLENVLFKSELVKGSID